MALKYRSTNIYVKPDVRYKSKLVSKFINCYMEGGKKSTAEGIFYRAMDIVEKKITGTEPAKIFETAIENVRPLVEVRSRRVGGATYQVPIEVPRGRGTALAIRWIIESCRSKKGKAMHLRMAQELTDAFNKEGSAFTKRENTHKMADANKAFAHFAR
jgi:small subunit ribosomal protein S7